MKRIDLNFDGGEGFDDALILPFVTTIHVACGGHAGDSGTMRATLRLAYAAGAAVGAHPSYPDRENFGRRRMAATPTEIEDFVRAQAVSLLSLGREEGVEVRLLKPHGALYHAAAHEADVAAAIARAAGAVGARRPGLVLVGPAGSRLEEAARAKGLGFLAEAFADRGYRVDGTLVPRGEDGALLLDPAVAARQALSIALEGRALSREGTPVVVRAETLCLHGDTPGAPEIARAVRRALEEAAVTVAALG